MIVELIYILSAFLFIIGLKLLSSPATARRGNFLSAAGMFLAVVVTLFNQLDYQWIVAGLLVGGIIGVLAARLVAMTAMPEMVALFNGFGGIASLLVAWNEFAHKPWTELLGQGAPTGSDGSMPHFTAAVIFLSVLIGGTTFTGSLTAWGKLSGKLSQKPLMFPGQKFVNAILLLGALAAGVAFTIDPREQALLFTVILAIPAVFGVLSVIPIGGADMPVVISLLNSYSGLAACFTGFVIQNNVLVVTGSLVGASGLILTRIMCKAMNRSLANVLFSGFGSATTQGSSTIEGEVKPISHQDAYYILEAAGSVAFVPGYGMAVAQAQHALRELGELMEKNGAEVRYAIHPVAGRMPGHMNVLLAEANVPYDQLVEMDDINPIMDSIDVCVVIGANDVVNPAAAEDKNSPIYGMPIIEVSRAKTVIVLKRSLAAGFAGIENHLFYKDNTRMLFGDAKGSLQELVSEFKET